MNTHTHLKAAKTLRSIRSHGLDRVLRILGGALVVSAALSAPLAGATVSWSPVQTIASNTDIVHPENVVQALNYGGTDVDVNVEGTNVVFEATLAPFCQQLSSILLFSSAGTTVAGDFGKVLDSVAYSYTAGPCDPAPENVETVTFTGLTPGKSYAVQVFTSDDRGLLWNTGLEIAGASTAIHTGAGASTFAIATVVLGPAETGFDLVVTGLATGPGGASSYGYDLALVNAVVLAEVPPPPTATFFGPLPYLSAADIPAGLYDGGVPDVLEDCEDAILDPSIEPSSGRFVGPGGYTDSVDADDGVIDGSGTDGWAWYYTEQSSLFFTFNPPVTAAGLVITDAVGHYKVRAIGSGGAVLGTTEAIEFFVDSFKGQTGEDRFIGVQDPAGIVSLRIWQISEPSGFLELDHIQHGRMPAAAQ